MSNVFQHLVRDTGGAIPLEIGSGAPVSPVSDQGLLINSDGQIYANDQATIAFFLNGLPFDTNGRLVVHLGGDVSYLDQAVPFTAENRIAIGV